MSGASVGEEMYLEVRAFPFENTEEVQDEGEELSDVKVDENSLSVVEVMLHIDQVYEVPDPLQSIEAELRKGLKASICMHGFDFIHGLLDVMARQPVPKCEENITHLLDGSAPQGPS